MWIKFGVLLTIFGFIHQIKCEDISYSDIYLPAGTNGFVCQLNFYPIEHVREAVERAFRSFFFEKLYRKFPKLFEDTQLFDVKPDILLSWPILFREIFYDNRNVGKVRLVFNTRGQIMGLVMIKPKETGQKISFERCNPVRKSLEEDNAEKSSLNQWWNLVHPAFGYKCGLKFFPESSVNKLKEPDWIASFPKRRSRSKKAIDKKYTGDEFSGDDLYWYPVHHKLSRDPASGSPGVFRAVFDMSNHEFKGIINTINRNEKCVTVWDLSSIRSENIYTPSSVLNLERIKDSYWPETCFGHRILSKTIWLYLEFALKDWESAFYGRIPNFPIIKKKVIRLWPIRTPENHDNSFKNMFAIGYHTELDSYSLYHSKIKNNLFSGFSPCFEFSLSTIRNLRKHLAEPHGHGESSFLVY
ncbi:BgtE-5561 [Blumeria graminis f. sp. tritici]|uniref:BgtE-5561 n=3 Tax=Blumeria graminis f. sp. tritici TaxID=62690 RepID=A0A9X9MPX8_BLUGR|nr:BgtE-5561 [Blumeria graminis f. sp. tritici]